MQLILPFTNYYSLFAAFLNKQNILGRLRSNFPCTTMWNKIVFKNEMFSSTKIYPPNIVIGGATNEHHQENFNLGGDFTVVCVALPKSASAIWILFRKSWENMDWMYHNLGKVVQSLSLEAIDQTLYEIRFTSLNEIKWNSFKISTFAKKKKKNVCWIQGAWMTCVM